MSETLQPKIFGPGGFQSKMIRSPRISDMSFDRSPDEVGSFAKSEIEALKIHKVLSGLRPFCNRTREEIMEFVCYMFEIQGHPGKQICTADTKNRKFFFISSGELLHMRPSTQHSQAVEQKLFESDYWGLECLFTGKDDRVSVTVTTQCRLYVLTAKRFFWLSKMCAQRTLRLQLVIVDKLVKDLPSVQRFLGVNRSDVWDTVKTAPQEMNSRMRNCMLHQFRLMEVPPPSKGDKEGGLLLVCYGGESLIIYALTGCVKLLQDSGNRLSRLPMSDTSIVLLQSGEFHEISANQHWFLCQGPQSRNSLMTQQTLVYLIRLKPMDRNSDSTAE